MAAIQEYVFQGLGGVVAAGAACTLFIGWYVRPKVAYSERVIDCFEQEGLYRAPDVDVSGASPDAATREVCSLTVSTDVLICSNRNSTFGGGGRSRQEMNVYVEA